VYNNLYMKRAKSTDRGRTFYEVKLHPHSSARCDEVTVYRTLGALLRQTRLRRGLSLRNVAFRAGLSPMYLSLLERDACGPPSDEKLESLAKVLEEPNPENVFAKAGRVTPRVASIILRHPTQWGEFLHACEHFGADDVSKLKEAIMAGTPGTGKTQVLLESIAANTQRVSAATRRAQLEQIVEAAEKEERIQQTSHFRNGAALAGVELADVKHELTRRGSKLKRRTDIFDRAKNRAGEPAHRSGLQCTVASKTSEK
jgi:transcriptional regulator with XRE-family HTH domain